jgi:hypothetical protein
MLVYDNHKYFFVLLYLLKIHSLTTAGAAVLHIDRHWDTRQTELSKCRLLNKLISTESCVHYTDLILQEGDFLLPAISIGLIVSIAFCVPANEFEQTTNLGACRRAGAEKAVMLQDLAEVANLDTEHWVLDIDLDYFLDESGLVSVPATVLGGLLKRRWRGVGIALSPNHCGGHKAAIKYLRDAFSLAEIPTGGPFGNLFMSG